MKYFARTLIMVDPWNACSRLHGAEIVMRSQRSARLDEWLNSFQPAIPVSLQRTDRDIYDVAYLVLFMTPDDQGETTITEHGDHGDHS